MNNVQYMYVRSPVCTPGPGCATDSLCCESSNERTKAMNRKEASTRLCVKTDRGVHLTIGRQIGRWWHCLYIVCVMCEFKAQIELTP